MDTRICRLHAAHDIRIETLDLAGPGPGEVLVALGAGGICGSDLHYFHNGGFGPVRVREPIILGHEAAGTVAALGDGVTGLAVGDKVALNPSSPCGECKFCAEGSFNHCLSMRFNGSAMRLPHEQGFFRDRMAVKAANCVPVGADTPITHAACSEPLAVCLHARSHAGDLTGKRVLVTGAGPIGALCVALARQGGAAEVVVTDIQDATLAVAKRMGADHALNTGTDPAALAPWMADKGAFDVTFECSAAAPALRAAIEATRPGGIIVQVGVTGDIAIPLNLLVGKEISLTGTHRFHAEFAEAAGMISRREIDVSPMITGTYPMADAAAAFAAAGDRARSVKVLLTFGA